VETQFLALAFAICAMMFAMSTPIHHLVYLARRALSVGSQGDFGEMMGVSRRTGQRWETGRADPSWDTICEMARRVHPHDAGLAAQLAQAAGTDLVALGLVAPPPPPQPVPPPGPPPPAAEDIVDAIVCAAAEAINLPPRDVRPALLAAFARARRLGIPIETVESTLGAAKTAG
jgi:DNA-binding XRE family transcriptional regulator